MRSQELWQGRAGSDAASDFQIRNSVTDARHRLEFGLEPLHDKRLKVVKKYIGKRMAIAFLRGGFNFRSPLFWREPHKGFHIGSPLKLNSGVGQELDLGICINGFAVDQHAVAVEYDEFHWAAAIPR